MPRRHDIHHGDDGLTLVEVLVALAIFAMTAALLAQGLSRALRILKMSETSTETAATTAARMAIEHVVAQARMPQDRLTESGSALIGQPHSLRLITTYVPKGQYGGLYDTNIFLVPSKHADQFDLVIEERMLRKLTGALLQPPLVRRADLLRNISNVKFRFFGKPNDASQPSWSDSWQIPTRLPGIIAIDVAFPGTDIRKWSTLQVDLPLAN